MGALFTIIAAAFHSLCNGIYRYVLRKSEGWFAWVLLLLPVVFFLLFIFIASGNKYTDSASAAFGALMRDNEAVWQEQLHPEYGAELMEYEAFRAELEKKGIDLNMSDRLSSELKVRKIDSDYEGQARIVTGTIRCNGRVYKVEAVYVDNEAGSGFAEFRVSTGVGYVQAKDFSNI